MDLYQKKINISENKLVENNTKDYKDAEDGDDDLNQNFINNTENEPDKENNHDEKEIRYSNDNTNKNLINNDEEVKSFNQDVVLNQN